MLINFDYHTHTTYSHGKGTILENALAAKKVGLEGIAITDHGFSHVAFGMKRKKVLKMLEECSAAQREAGVTVRLGIEANILGEDGKSDITEKDYDTIDVYLAGIHRAVWYSSFKDFSKLLMGNVFASKDKPSQSFIDYNTRVYVNAIKNNPIDVLTHLNYLVLADPKTVAQCCADYGTYLEISTKKVHLTPEEWQKVFDTNVNFLINSDAHSPDRVGDVALFKELQKTVNFPMDRIYNVGDKHPTLRYTELRKHI